MQRDIKREIIDALEGVRHGIKSINVLYMDPLVVQFSVVGRIDAETVARVRELTQGYDLHFEYDEWNP